MFKKLLSALTLMLVMLSMNAGAQNLQKESLGDNSVAKNVKTFKIDDLKGTEKWMGYWDGTLNADNVYMVGSAIVPSTYGVAIGYPAGSEEMAGKTIEGIKFSFLEDTNIENIRVFIATQLPGINEKADVCMDFKGDGLEQDMNGNVIPDKITGIVELVDINNNDSVFNQDWVNNWNEIRFSKPYKVNPGKPVYIGYIFLVQEPMNGAPKLPEARPILAKSHLNVPSKPGSFFVNLAGQGWDDASKMMAEDKNGNKYGLEAAIQVLVSGEETAANDVIVAENKETIIGKKGSTQIPVTINNVGTNGISSLEVEVDVNGIKTSLDPAPSTPIKGLGAEFSFIAIVDTPTEGGSYDYTISVKKINGEPVSKKIEAKGKMIILTRDVRHKVFFEEFTGMWCDNCPWGHVAMEKLHQMYGDNVVRVAAHYDDALQCVSEDYVKFMSESVSSYPSAHIDRTIASVHPYRGYTNSYQRFAVADEIEKCLKTVSVAEVFSKPTLEGDKVIARADVKFLFSGYVSNYAIGLMLTEDGIQGPDFIQKSNMSKYKKEDYDYLKSDPLLQPWINGSNAMPCVFNNVVHDAWGMKKGRVGSLPLKDPIKAEETISYTYEFDLTKCKNIQNRDNLCVAVVLFNRDGSGVIVNSDIAPVNPSASGIENVSGSNNVVETARYTIDGRRINTAEKGINIVKYSDGTVKKIIVK